MQDAAELTESSMVALIGADEAQALVLCEEALNDLENQGGEVLVPANFNCPGQIVISGSLKACERAEAVADKMGIAPENVVTSGDTGNDLDMMRAELGFRGIAVGNAAPELKAFDPPHVYHAKANFAAGIREGLEAYGWL